jgi:signal transduction histidine kinase
VQRISKGSRLAPRHLCMALAIAWVALSCQMAAAQEGATRTILIIQFGSEDGLNNVDKRRAINEALQSQSTGPLAIFTEQLRSDRLPEEEASQGLANDIRSKFQGRAIDLVITDHVVSFEFATRFRSVLFPDAPLVFSGYSAPDEGSRRSGAGITGVISGDTYRQTAELALGLHPAARQILVIAEAPDESLTQGQHTQIRALLRGLPQGIEVAFLRAPTLTRLMAALKHVRRDSLILYVDYLREDPDQLLDGPFADRLIAQQSPVPVYGISARHIGSGVVGGVISLPGPIGTRLGEMARQILAGTRAQDIPIEKSPRAAVLDWRALQRWSIDLTGLPANADIRFRPPTVWDSYRGYIIAAGSLVLVQALLILGLLAQRARRRSAEAILKAREADLRKSYDETRQLAGRLVTAQEAERTRISRELHDDVGQRMASLAIGLSAVKRRLREADAPEQVELSRLQAQLVSVTEEIRQVSHDLHPGELEHVGLAAALEERCAAVTSESGVTVRVDIAEGWPRDLPQEMALCLYRVAQEALRNITRHAHARKALVSLVREPEKIIMRISDDGCGFDPPDTTPRGLGLVSMRERVRMLGGSLQLDTLPGGGTVVSAILPLGGSS